MAILVFQYISLGSEEPFSSYLVRYIILSIELCIKKESIRYLNISLVINTTESRSTQAQFPLGSPKIVGHRWAYGVSLGASLLLS